ncbi:MAG: DNA polymerase IV [Myxococcales bacterium]|nr:DNA polymerase IV [Myxococcales bacterium]MCB9549246.1 DNA polymerase IV [Myxococcales bacterium]
MDWSRVIVHADMDAFYAAVEVLDDPSLRGKPVLIGHTGGRGVVATASYEARRYGIHSAMPMATALRRCPDPIIRPPRMARYSEVSRVIMGVFRSFSPTIQPLSIDEAFLDCTETATAHPGPHELGAAIKAAVRAATGLTVSVGVAETRFVAKVASDFRKPDGLTVVGPGEARAFLAPQSVSRLWGAGPRTVERLHALGLKTIADVAAADPTALAASLGSAGRHFHRLAHAQDDRPVVTERRMRSLSTERTLAEDIVGAEAVRPHLERQAEEVARRLRQGELLAGGVRVKLKTHRFQVTSRQLVLDAPTDEAAVLLAAAERLLAAFELGEPLRLVGVGTFQLSRRGDQAQLLLPLEDP